MLICRTSFAGPSGVTQEGVVVRTDDPRAKSNPDCFEELRVEEATARPGESRTVTTPKKSAVKKG